jgi:hypothetical protein
MRSSYDMNVMFFIVASDTLDSNQNIAFMVLDNFSFTLELVL